MRRRRVGLVAPITALGAIAIASAAACIPGTGPALIEQPDATPPPPVDLSNADAGGLQFDVDLGDSFQIAGLVPSHGPFTGKTRAVIAGRGFSSDLRVWIGGTEIDPSAIFASDPTRAAVETPPGTPGAADVRVRNQATAQERVLAAGFFYDAFALVPDTGSTTGGTRVSVVGQGTSWISSTSVAIDGKPCTDLVVTDATHLQCTTPASTPGSKDVKVTSGDGSSMQATDAYLYSDTPDGYRGGLGGGVLDGHLRVLAFDAWTGTPIPSAYVIAGAFTKLTDASGIVQIVDPSLKGAVTVTVAAKCHQPMTFVADPVDTVTAYLTPTLDPSCAQGDPPSSGGGTGLNAGEVDGELVWPGVEFKPGEWTVPAPTRSTERRAAYVFTATGSPSDGFGLPSVQEAVTPDKPGSHGYPYLKDLRPGNATLYALAGIEDRSVTPPTFVPYVMGIARGVSVKPSAKTPNVDIPMTTLLDHQVTLTPHPPAPGARGPDRLISHVAVTLGISGFAVFPNGARSSLLPLVGTVPFVGVPALDGTLTGEEYAITASAYTGPFSQAPASIVGEIRTTDSNTPVSIGGFLAPPVIDQPGAGTWSGTHVDVGTSGAVDLVQTMVVSGGGLVVWTIVAPGSTTSFDLPDLRPLAGSVGLVAGPIQTTVFVARLDSFSYGSLRSGQMGTGAWNAYAFDQIHGAY